MRFGAFNVFRQNVQSRFYGNFNLLLFRSPMIIVILIEGGAYSLVILLAKFRNFCNISSIDWTKKGWM